MSKSIKKSVKSIARTLQSVIENLEGHENGFANLVESIDDLGNELSRVQERITDLEGGEPFTMNQEVYTRVEEEPTVVDYCKADVEATEKLYTMNPPVFPRVVPDLVVDNSSSVINAVLSEISGRLSGLEKRLDDLDAPVVDLNSAEEDSKVVNYIQRREYTYLVAFTVGAQDRESGHHHLMESLPGLVELTAQGSSVTSWWVAEDDRLDRSDCDSAVFVHPGAQAKASRALEDLELSGANNVVNRRITNPAFKGKQI